MLHRPTVDQDVALIDGLQARNGAQRRGLAASRLAEQHDEFVVGDGEIEVLDDLDGTEIFLDAAKFDLRSSSAAALASCSARSRGILVVTSERRSARSSDASSAP